MYANPTSARLGRIPSGAAGTRATLGIMRALANRALTVPEFVESTARIVSSAGRDAGAQAQRLRLWLHSKFRFVRDPLSQETLRAPLYQLRRALREGETWGDCDDLATLSAAMAKAVGLPARFVVLAFAPSPLAPYRHVYTEVLTPRGWLDLDVTRDGFTRLARPSRRALMAV